MLYFLSALGAAPVVFLLYVATRPSAFRIERTRTVEASAAAVFAQLHDFRAWARWSPWDQLDPAMKRTYEGAATGEGARYRWQSDDGKVGAGAMTILSTSPDARVDIELEFIKPFAATNCTVFTLEPVGAGTKVTWTMTGHNAFMAKAFGVFVNMDQLVGKDFEKGLSSLEAAAKG